MRIDRIKLITEMARKNLNVKDLVEKSGLSKVTISSVRSGKGCSKYTAEKIAKSLDMDVSDLMEVSE